MRPTSVVRTLSGMALAVLTACAAAPLSPAAASVTVYQALLDGPPTPNTMPSGCEEILRTPPRHRSELDRIGSTDPYRDERATTAAAGGNVLLVLERLISPRTSFDCAAASPITDCPPSMGAWFDVVFVSYACSAQSLSELARERLP